MILSKETMAKIESQIENVDVDYDGSKDFKSEVEVGNIIVLVSFTVFAHFVEDFNFHSEVSYNSCEDLSHYEFDDAEIKEVKAYDEDGREIEVTNKCELAYW